MTRRGGARTGQRRRRRLGVVAGVAAALLLAALARPLLAEAAAAQLPLTVTNSSGRPGPTYVYVIARNGLTGQQGYVDAAGTWRAFALPASVPSGQPNPPAPDVAIPGPDAGASARLTLPPDLAGGRIYLSMGAKLSFFLTPGGLVEPAPWVSSDPNHDVLYDWAEFARVGSRIFVNTTTVDMFGVPLSVTVRNGSGGTRTEGALNVSRDGVFDAVRALGGDWGRLATTRASDGVPLRVLAPAHGIADGVFAPAYLDRYVTDVWSYYSSHTLTVTMDLGTFTGSVSYGGFTFRNAAGAVVGTLPRPTTSEVFGCGGSLQPQGQPDETAILAIGARVCAGLNRATLSTAARVASDTQPTTDAGTFYQQPASNLYSKVMHDSAVSGHAYGFAYDDVANVAPTIDEPDPSSMTLTIGAFSGSAAGGGAGGGATTIAGPGGTCVDVAGDDTGGDGAHVQLWSCQSYAADQHWTWQGSALTALGRCLDVAGGGTANGTRLQLHDCTGNPAQQWVVRGDALVNPQSGRCIDAPGGATANGTRLQIYDCNGTAAQVFRKT